MSIESMIFMHSSQRISDLAFSKNTDFQLAQNELYISSQFFVDLIQDWRFNKKALGGPNLDNLDRFNKYSQSMMVML